MGLLGEEKGEGKFPSSTWEGMDEKLLGSLERLIGMPTACLPVSMEAANGHGSVWQSGERGRPQGR